MAVYPQQIAFNVLPQIDSFEDNGYTREEMKMIWETRKILDDDAILVNPTAGRVLKRKPLMQAMADTIHRAGRRSRYRLRKQVVEPVFGQIKHARGFRQFLLRGLQNVSAEWTASA